MAYCRFGECDVYLFHDGQGWNLMTHDPADGGYYATREETIDALLALRERGFDVPQEAIDRLRLEAEHGKQIYDIG